MAGIQLGGLFTGIDTGALIGQLMALERGTLTRYQARQKVWSDRETALRELESKLGALQGAVQALSRANDLRAFRTTSSNADILTVEDSPFRSGGRTPPARRMRRTTSGRVRSFTRTTTGRRRSPRPPKPRSRIWSD
jgi:hypothetical protein